MFAGTDERDIMISTQYKGRTDGQMVGKSPPGLLRTACGCSSHSLNGMRKELLIENKMRSCPGASEEFLSIDFDPVKTAYGLLFSDTVV
jgi:hypothetical protein